MQALLVHGANVNVTGKDSLTPLHICCSGGDYKTLNVLLQARPSLTARTSSGKTALEIAETKGFEDICSRLTTLLVSSGADSTMWQQQGDRASAGSRSGGRGRDGQAELLQQQQQQQLRGNEKKKKNNHALPALISADSSSRKGSSSSISSGSSSSSSGSGSSRSGYQLMGQNMIPGQDDNSSALRKQLDQEYRDKKALENKVSE